MGLKRRKFTREFKIGVIREIEAGKPTAQVSREHNIQPALIYKWKRQYKEDPERAFSRNGQLYRNEARIVELERMVGQLTMENDLLKKALQRLERRDHLKKGGQGK